MLRQSSKLFALLNPPNVAQAMEAMVHTLNILATVLILNQAMEAMPNSLMADGEGNVAEFDIDVCSSFFF